jgi:hypothetical protein
MTPRVVWNTWSVTRELQAEAHVGDAECSALGKVLPLLNQIRPTVEVLRLDRNHIRSDGAITIGVGDDTFPVDCGVLRLPLRLRFRLRLRRLRLGRLWLSLSACCAVVAP